MYNKRSVGTQNEKIAADYLTERGYRILWQNFRCKSGEIDIIAKDGEYLVFLEVKYRANTAKGLPQEAIDYRKIQKISRTARYYMLINGISMEHPCRFDVVTILGREISLLQNAFEAIF